MTVNTHTVEVLICGLDESLFDSTAGRLAAGLAVRRCPDLHQVEGMIQPACTTVVVIQVSAGAAPDALSVACRLRELCPAARVIFVAEKSSEGLLLGALRAGVSEYLTAPVTGWDIADAVHRFLPSTLEGDECSAMVGVSQSIREVRALIRRIATMNSTVLITGETGTGKEVAARLIHQLSRRSEKALICVNCGAVPDTLLESELFGYEKGAFTGAVTRHPGQFQLANGGTLFLDEIGDMSLTAQSKVLRAIEQHEVQPLGGGKPVSIDIRTIAATHHDLEQLVNEGRFRSDLFYRLHVARLALPPLMERAEDIPLLAQHFLRQINREHGRGIEGFTAAAMRLLSGHRWPGNVRQLRNTIEAAALMCDSRYISEANLRALHCFLTSRPTPLRMTGTTESSLSTVSEPDRLMQALEATNWNVTRAAQLLSWSRVTVYRKVAKYQLGRNAQAV
jgi:DNA-binding NtrC family response regulator